MYVYFVYMYIYIYKYIYVCIYKYNGIDDYNYNIYIQKHIRMNVLDKDKCKSFRNSQEIEKSDSRTYYTYTNPLTKRKLKQCSDKYNEINEIHFIHNCGCIIVSWFKFSIRDRL